MPFWSAMTSTVSHMAEPRWRARAAVFLALATIAVPFLVAGIPPLADYPNHLARLWLHEGGIAREPVSGMYRFAWDTMTNIGVDLAARMLAPLLGWEVLGRLLATLAGMLPPIGGALLWARLHGRAHWWQIAFGMLAWSMGLLFGFVNFQIGLGFALLAAAADPALSRLGSAGWGHLLVAAAGRATLGLVLMLTHVFAFAFYAALLAGIALGASWRGFLAPGARLPALSRIAVAVLPLALAAAILALLSPRLPGSQSGGSLAAIWEDVAYGWSDLLGTPWRKPAEALSGLRTYHDGLDALTGLALLAPVVVALATRRLRVHAGMMAATLGLAVLYVLVPSGLLGTAVVDARFAMMATLTLTVALRPDVPAALGRMLRAGLLAVCLLRTGAIAWIWHARQADVASVARALEPVPPGAAVMPLKHDSPDETMPLGRVTRLMHTYSFGHLPALALPWRRAFTPMMFSAKGKQPLRVLPPWSEISEPDGGTLGGVALLTDPAEMARTLAEIRYPPLWRERFDFILILNADTRDIHGPFRPPPGLSLVRDDGFAQLWRIERAR